MNITSSKVQGHLHNNVSPHTHTQNTYRMRSEFRTLWM